MNTENIPSASAEEEFERYGTYATNTVGTSMQPLFKTHRDVVILKKVDRPLVKYDVVMYPTGNGKYILHRIIGVKGDVYVIRGDNTFSKEYVPKTAVIGYMVSFNRRGKHHDTSELRYRFYSRFWHFIYPVRKLILLSKIFLSKIKHKIFG